LTIMVVGFTAATNSDYHPVRLHYMFGNSVSQTNQLWCLPQQANTNGCRPHVTLLSHCFLTTLLLKFAEWYTRLRCFPRQVAHYPPRPHGSCDRQRCWAVQGLDGCAGTPAHFHPASHRLR